MATNSEHPNEIWTDETPRVSERLADAGRIITEHQARITQLEKAIDDVLKRTILAHETSGYSYYRITDWAIDALKKVRQGTT